jgi:hypothetical protein
MYIRFGTAANAADVRVVICVALDFAVFASESLLSKVKFLA